MSVAFNSAIGRSKMETSYNPGPGQYNSKNAGAFKIDFVASNETKTDRRIMSQEGGPRSQAFTAATGKRLTNAGPSMNGGYGMKSKDNISSQNRTGNTFYSDGTAALGNPSYTIKDGGTLKKKV